ncbi:MAG: ParA family protein [Hornefia sp.]|nr:ParA family protein [Hornefia sp.]
MSKVIAVVNHKGGVGKTTVTLNFGAELAERGYKVLLIDFDMQGNLTKGIGIGNCDKLKDTIASAMDQIMCGENGKCNIKIYPTDISGNLDIVPCNVSMADTKLKLQLAMARETVLKKVISNIEKKYAYDYIIIDNAPTIEIDFQNSLVASDEVLIVTNPDIFSTEGMVSLLREYTKVRTYFNKTRLKIAGILINNADGRTNFTKDMIKAVKSTWGDLKVFDTIIPQSVRVKESQANQISIKGYEKKNKVAIAFSSFTDEYLR